MSRLTEWVDMQRRLVQHGSGVAVLRLKGPDDSVWGTWPIDTEHLADTITATVQIISEELPKGRHPCQIRAYDENGGEVSVMPLSVEGKSSAATSAAAEQLTLQKATSAAIYNANVMNEGLRKQVEHLNESLSTLAENNVTLIDQLQTMAANNAERDLRDARRDAANEAFLAVCGAVQKNAAPLLELVLLKWGPKDKPTPRVEQAETKPPTIEAPKPTPTETEPPREPEQRQRQSTSPPASESGNGAPGNGAASPTRATVDARQRTAGVRRDGAASPGTGSHAARAARKSERARAGR